MCSHHTNEASSTRPAASDAATGADIQEFEADSMRPKIRASRPAALVRTPGTSTGRVSGFRDSGTTVTVRAMPARANGTLTQKMDDHPNTPSRRPPTTGPRPKPRPATVAQIPIALARAFPAYVSLRMDSASQAEYVVVEEQHLTAKPAGVPWEEAGALFVAGTTAYAAVRAVGLTGGDTVAVSGAAGGVGSIAVQLARHAGATVIGLASEAHHPWLAGHGVIPVAYGDGIADRIRQAASKVDAFVDTFGAGYVQLALELGVEPSRIDTIVNFEAVARYGVNAEGNAAASTASVLAELAGLIAAGELELPIAARFPLDRVQDAYRRLAEGHVLGKIVLLP